jgi:heme-degrading monooxygenase HmoA
MSLARTPAPPYYAVIFSSLRTPGDHGYSDMAALMERLVAAQPGYLGHDSARDDGCGITVAYFDSLESIAAWKRNTDHALAQKLGREKWYEAYEVRVCRVERAYGFPR